MSSSVPKEVAKAAAEQMLATIYNQRAQFEVQQIVNGHTLSDRANKEGMTYEAKYAELADAEDRLRDHDVYGALLP